MTIVHMHVPKCAGTSFLSILRDWYPNRVIKSDKPTDDMFKSSVVLSGHFPYNSEYEVGYKWITFIRHPIDRLQSFYYYTLSRGKRNRRNYWWNIIKNMDLEDWLQCDHSKNLMTKQFCGKTPQEQLLPGDLEIAKQNANKFYFIGVQENFANDVNFLASKLGKPNLNIPTLLKSNNPGITDTLEYSNELDFELYYHILG